MIDDQADARDLLKNILERCEATVTAVSSAGEAIAALSRSEFDILISDIAMPHEDGFALIEKNRQSDLEKIKSIPAVALTARAGTEDRLRLLSAGFDSHIAKPFEPAELVAVIAALAQRIKSI